MPSGLPECFRPHAPAAAEAAGPSLTTSVYDTHLGLVALSWSRTSFGLSLRAVLRLGPAADPDCAGEEEEETMAFRVRPWLFWKRRGSKRFHLDSGGRRHVDVAWDLSRARFASSGSPEPASGFYVAVAVDGEMALVAGDLVDEAYKKTKTQKPKSGIPVLISRREHVCMADSGSGRSYKTTVRIRGKEREISLGLIARDKERQQKEKGEVGMWISVDGDRILHVKRLRWKFRGSDRFEIGGGDHIQVSWDLHNWLFPQREAPQPSLAAATEVSPAAPAAHAVFVFKCEIAGGQGLDLEAENCAADKAGAGAGKWRGYFGRWGRGGDWSESSSGGETRKKRNGRRLTKAGSSSSASAASSSMSWASGSSVMDWASAEEVEMQHGDGFSLVVYASKS